jgi:hypothetical protein
MAFDTGDRMGQKTKPAADDGEFITVRLFASDGRDLGKLAELRGDPNLAEAYRKVCADAARRELRRQLRKEMSRADLGEGD